MAGKFKFKAYLHPRGAKGQFIETPDKVKPSTQVTKGTKRRKRQAFGLPTPKKMDDAYKSAVGKLAKEQRERLESAVAAKAQQLQRPPQVTKVTAKGNSPKTVTKGTKVTPSKTVGAAQDKTLTTPTTIKVRRSATKVTITESGVHTTVKHHPSFKVTNTKGYNYTVEHGGVTLSLNNHSTTMEYGDYRVRGVPPVLPEAKKRPTGEVVDKLAMAQHQTTKGNAPQWNPDTHGSAPDPRLVGTRKANPGVPHYGVMQIHHVDQWAKDPARAIETDLREGRITPAQAQARYVATIERRPNITPKGNADDDDEDDGGAYQLKLRPKEDREFVVLAGGMHQGGTPLYLANHPKFYDPDAGKFKPIGIPHTGEGSREWFEKEFRKPFWKEYAKVQVTELGKELDRRVKKGQITVKEAQTMLADAQARVKKGEIEW